MDFHKLLEVASAQQNDVEQQKKTKAEKKPTQPTKIKRDRPKGVMSANVKTFLERKEREEKQKEEEEKRKKEQLLQKRMEAKHGKTAKAMASRTKDNLQYYTKEKLDRFVAEENERQQKQLEKEERKYQKRLEKERRATEGTKRKRRSKHEIAKDRGQIVDMPKSTVGVTIEKKKPRPPPKQSKPTLDFNALIQMAQEKLNKPVEQSNQTVSKTEQKRPQPGPGRPMTQEEKERWERTHTKEYQLFLKKGGKRPEFPGAKKERPSGNSENNSRESSQEPRSNSKVATKGNDVAKKQVPQSSSESKSKSNDIRNNAGKKTFSNSESRGGASKLSDKSKHIKQEPSSRRDIPSSPEPEINETVIQCGPSKPKAAVKRKSDEPGMNPFDRIINRYDVHRPPPEKKYRQVIESDSEEEYDSEMDDFIDDEDEENDYSSAIRDIFGYDKKKYRYEEDDVSDMEANYASIMKEEARSAKIGRMEDEEDMRREEEELKRKAEKKKMRERELKQAKKMKRR